MKWVAQDSYGSTGGTSRLGNSSEEIERETTKVGKYWIERDGEEAHEEYDDGRQNIRSEKQKGDVGSKR